MVGNILIMVVIFALALLLFWLALRAGQIRNGILRWILRIVAGLAGLLVTAIFVLAAIGYYRLNVPPARNQAPEIQVQASPEQLAAAEKKASLCAGCHSTTGSLPLDGGSENFLAEGPPLGVLYPPNLTPGGGLKDWSDGQVIRAIREGIDHRGRPMLVMPSASFHSLSDEDVQNLVAYMRTQPAVQHDTPERNLTPLAAVLLGAGVFPTAAQPPITEPVPTPPLGTAEYGKYIALAYGCQDCHGPTMTGVAPGGFGPSGPNLTQIVPNWSEEDFILFFHEGKDPSGRVIDPNNMPWNEYGQAFSDEELKSLYLYLHALPPTAASR